MNTSLHTSLLEWYEAHGRHGLPWRINPDPYAIYVSEIMLQQTQVKTVLERFYFPFLEAFPTLQDLADADQSDVLKKWEGLGYYTRARNLHKAARQVQGVLPKTAEELLRLPGIGRSTANAIAAFAYREPLPILDANVKRILHRYFALSERDEKKLWKCAYALLDSAHPFEYNQAMMDIGSSICLPKKPLCSVCPFEPTCKGKTSPLTYPEAKKKTIKPIRKPNIILYRRAERFALKERTSRFLHGLWGFAESEENIAAGMHYLGHITQHYSHFTLDAEVYLCEEMFDDEGFEWFELHEISALSLSRADHKAMALLRYNLKK